VVALFLYSNTDNFGKKGFYYQASFRMVGSNCRKRATKLTYYCTHVYCLSAPEFGSQQLFTLMWFFVIGLRRRC
jgi:hypothetical protein